MLVLFVAVRGVLCGVDARCCSVLMPFVVGVVVCVRYVCVLLMLWLSSLFVCGRLLLCLFVVCRC